MRTSKYSPEQIAQALRQAESGTPIVEICRKLQVTEQTFYRWKKKFGELGTPEIRELRQLREENRKLKPEPVNENETFERKVYEGIWTTAV